MITYENASQIPTAFHRLFGCSVDEFDALYAEFAVTYDLQLVQSTLTRKEATPRKRKRGAGRRFKHALRDRLLLALFWLQVYPTLELLGLFFALDKTSVEDNLKDMLATLSTIASFALEYPDMHRRKLRTLEQVLEDFPDVALVIEVPECKKPPPQNGSAEMSPDR
jgi:hypothetical protein